MNAALGVRFFPEDLLAVRLVADFLAAGLLALLLADFFPAVFLLVVAIACLPVIVRTLRASGPAKLPCHTVHSRLRVAIGKRRFSLGKWLPGPSGPAEPEGFCARKSPESWARLSSGMKLEPRVSGFSK